MSRISTRLVAWTDGGCRGNPGLGAWAFLIVDRETGKALERSDGERTTTNNRMEMLAAINALESLRQPSPVTLVTDSRYLIDCCTKWMAGWKRAGWKRKAGALKNVDLLQRLDDLQQLHQVSWQWVKGHSGEPGNEHVDTLLNQAMDRLAAGQEAAWENRGTWPVV